MSTLPAMDRAHLVLIERRLDSIERNLMDSRVSRSQRHEIVQGVEREVYAMLAAHSGEVTREVVLRVLGSLNPPEAYCGAEPRELPVRAAGYAHPAPPSPPATSGNQSGPYGYQAATPQPYPTPEPCLAPPTCATPNVCATPDCGHTATSSMAFAALVLALLSIPAIIVVPIGTILAFIGAICGAIAWHQISASGGRLGGKRMAIASFVIFAIHLCVLCVILVAM